MNLKQLEAFVQVSETKSFSRAAKALFLTQPTVSAHISALEKELKVRLFIRNTKEVELSKEGKLLFGYAKEMITLEDQIKRVFNSNKDEGASCITIAASTIPFQYVLPNILSKFSEKYPQDRFELVESDSADVIARVLAREVEVGFTGTMIAKPNCKYIPFFQDELSIITPNNEKFRKLQDEGLSIDVFRTEPIIMREVGSGTRLEVEKHLKSSGVSPNELNIIAAMGNQEAIKKSVSKGLGIAMLSSLATQKEVDQGELLRFSFPTGPKIRQLYVVQNKNQISSLAASRFVHLVQEEYGQIVTEGENEHDLYGQRGNDEAKTAAGH
jgi:DNA-binding transcriptional LysR family regulator